MDKRSIPLTMQRRFVPEGCKWWKYNQFIAGREEVDEKYHNSAFQKMIPVDEWWSPSFEGNYVHVSISIMPKPQKKFKRNLSHEGFIRVAVWGGDDTGMIKDFGLDKLEEAIP
jgi:hypothetical protein